MIERRQQPRLPLEARQPVGIGGESGRENLDRDITTEPAVSGAVDLAHTADAETSDDLVRPEPGPDRDAHRLTLAL
jgi:hypothetical protein